MSAEEFAQDWHRLTVTVGNHGAVDAFGWLEDGTWRTDRVLPDGSRYEQERNVVDHGPVRTVVLPDVGEVTRDREGRWVVGGYHWSSPSVTIDDVRAAATARLTAAARDLALADAIQAGMPTLAEDAALVQRWHDHKADTHDIGLGQYEAAARRLAAAVLVETKP